MMGTAPFRQWGWAWWAAGAALLLAILTWGCGRGSDTGPTLPSSASAPPPPVSSGPTPQPPTVATVSPNNGGGGVLVSITGKNFLGSEDGTLDSVTTVQFTGVSPLVLGSFTITSDKLLTVFVPYGARNGFVSVIMPNRAAATSPTRFEAEPVVTGVTPNLARPGVTTMKITGRNLCLATAVAFNGLASVLSPLVFVQLNGFTAVSALSTICLGSDLTSLTAVLPSTVTGPVSLVSVLTPSWPGTTPLEAPTQTSPGRVAILRSYTSSAASLESATAWGGLVSLAPRDIKTDRGALYFTDPDRFRLVSVDILTGSFLRSLAAPGGFRPINLALHSIGALTSIFATTDSLTSFVLRGSSSDVTLASFSLSALASQPDGLMEIGAPVAGQHLQSHITWFVDSRGGSSRLLSVRAVDGVALGSIAAGLGSVLAIGVNENVLGSLTSVWFTMLTSIGTIDAPLTSAVLRRFTIADFFALDGGVPAGLSFNSLGSVVIAAGGKIGLLTSTGTSAGLFSLAALASFGNGAPLVSSVAFDTTTAGSGNLWYADAGQNLIVRCEAGACATAGALTSFGLAAVGGRRPRVIAVDRLGSIWFDEPDALERLMP